MYPRLIINTASFEHNMKAIRRRFDESGFSFIAVTKVFCADVKLAAIAQNYCDWFGDSRLANIKRLAGFSKPKILIRIPMQSEVPELVRYCDASLNSELETVRLIDAEAARQGKIHKIVLMRDLGDLREGYFSADDFDAAINEIINMKNAALYGIGVNLTCVGAIIPSQEIMQKLADIAAGIESRYGVKLEIVSGGNSSSVELLKHGKMPKGINNLRIGEFGVCGRETAYGLLYEDMKQDVFTAEAEIIELKRKPSVPIGEVGMDAFGNRPVFEDKGVQLRAICALGKQDIDFDSLVPLNGGVELIGASSDHLLVDLTQADKEYKLGDVLSFNLGYGSILRAMTGEYLEKVYI